MSEVREQADSEPVCECGHVRDEHGGEMTRDTSCGVDDCDCFQFDASAPEETVMHDREHYNNMTHANERLRADRVRLTAEIAALREKARRFLGWRVLYERKRLDGSWVEIRRRHGCGCDLRDASISARWLRGRGVEAGKVRNVRVMRVFRKVLTQ